MKRSIALMSMLTLLACGGGETQTAGGGDALSGKVQADGSSTVFPITEAVAEEFQAENRDVRVTVGISGTGGGFKKLCAGEIDIADASRPIKQSEVDQCQASGIGYVEIPVAYDGIAIVVNPKNTWVDHLTVAELKKMWEPAAQGTVRRWSDIRAGWPDQEIRLFGAGVDSGTYDYFTEAVVGEQHASRGDYTSSEDDNVVVQGVATDPLALGFFGYAYYEENRDKLKIVPIDDQNESNGAGAIAPSPESVMQGTYQPLSRPVLIYASTRGLERPEVDRFVSFYLENAPELVREVGYIPLPAEAYDLGRKRVADRVTGSMFDGAGSKVGVSVEDLLRADGGSTDAPEQAPAATETTQSGS